MEPIPQDALYEPTQDERTYATLAHALQMVGWWIGPLVILCVNWNSKFVKFHALQALMLQLCTMLLMFVIMAAWVGSMFAMMPMQTAQPKTNQTTTGQGQSGEPQPCQGQAEPCPPGKSRPQSQGQFFPEAFFAVFSLIWLSWMGWFVLMIVLTVLYSIKAGRGEWKGYPLLGRLAARWAHIQLPH